jgi:uncharacterized protein
MTEEIKIYELKRVDLKGATVIDGFPSVGLVSSIAANYLINVLRMEQIGLMDSLYFPTVSLVREGIPQNPVRIYASERIGDENSSDRVVAFISEFQPPPNLVKPIAHAMLDWAEDQRCEFLLSPEGVVIDREDTPKEAKGIRDAKGVKDAKGIKDATGIRDAKDIKDVKDIEDVKDEGIEVYGVGSTALMRELLAKNKVEEFREGVITGVAGVLLNEGRRRDFNVATILAEAHPDYPDARAAAKIIEVIDRILLHIELDAKPLYEEAERIESQLKLIHKQTETTKSPSKTTAPPSMYG